MGEKGVLKKSRYKQRGITLIALVITIIILIILATISINAVFGENGIIRKTQQAKEVHKIGELTEKLELAKIPVQFDDRNITVLDKYIEEIIKQGIITQEDIEKTGEDNSRYITVEKEYVFLIEEKNKNIEITYQGKLKYLIPVVQIEVIDIQSTSIQIKANASRMEKGEYRYYIKNVTRQEEYKLIDTKKENEIIFTGLNPLEQYQIKVEAQNVNGTTTKESQVITTVEQKVTGIKLSEENISMTKGSTKTITATIEPQYATNKDVIWKSSDEQIATVNNGEIQAINSGTAKITAEAADGSGIKAICNITVIKQGTVTYYIDTGNTKTQIYNYGENALTPNFTPSKNGYTFIGWKEDSSANTSILTNKIVNTPNTNLYATFKKTVTLSYNGNGSTGGNTTSQSATKYYNNGNENNPTFTLNQNGFTKTNGKFNVWAMGNTNGTRYSPGNKVTLSESTTFYARWYVKTSVTQKSTGSISGWYQESNGINDSGSYWVTFPTPFIEPPTVTVNCWWGPGHSMDKHYDYGAKGVTTTGCYVWINIWNTGSTNYKFNLDWTATGYVWSGG